MSFLRSSLAIAICAAICAPVSFATTAHRKTTGAHKSSQAATRARSASSSHAATSTSKHTGSRTASHSASLRNAKYHRAPKRTRGQQAIDPDRVTQIQQALIREHYLDGEADGAWSASTVAAMQKYQADHGWQTKLMPDSRALMALGLGPDYSNAINAKDGHFAPPAPSAGIPAAQAAGFADASGVHQ